MFSLLIRDNISKIANCQKEEYIPTTLNIFVLNILITEIVLNIFVSIYSFNSFKLNIYMVLSLKEDEIARGKFVSAKDTYCTLNFSYYKVARVIFRNEILLSSSNDNKLYFHSSRGSVQL